MQLSKLILDVRGCKATDTRDMVFSIIGVADLEAFLIKLARLRSNARLRVKIPQNCVRRRFCITRKAMVVLLPEDTNIGLQIALFIRSLASHLIGQPDEHGH